MVTVVVCDDDAFLRQNVSQLCEEAGLTVVAETDSGRDAVELVRRFGVDVLLLDLALPDGSGEGALQALRDTDPHPVVIVLTAYAEDPDRLARLGAREVIEKPDFSRLESVLAQVASAARAAGPSAEVVQERRRTTREVDAPSELWRSPSGISSSNDLAGTLRAHKLQARADRPEIKEIDIEAKLNNIDLELAKNNLLPSLDAEAAPARQPEKFVLGLGYRFGLELRIPILQRRSRGEVLEAQGKADRFVLTQRFREQQVVIDVDNALSAIERAKERIAASVESLRLAKTLEEGERFRFSLGATSVLFVNLRERNSVDSEGQVIRAKADYQKALALYQWAIGAWGKSLPSSVPVMYRARD
jgi:CheY-like chemotaxis protein